MNIQVAVNQFCRKLRVIVQQETRKEQIHTEEQVSFETCKEWFYYEIRATN